MILRGRASGHDALAGNARLVGLAIGHAVLRAILPVDTVRTREVGRGASGAWGAPLPCRAGPPRLADAFAVVGVRLRGCVGEQALGAFRACG